MGIFEIIILIAAVIIFIILVRRFPQTADSSGQSRTRMSALAKFTHPLQGMNQWRPKLHGRKPVELVQAPSEIPVLEPDRQHYEPGSSPEELKLLNPTMRQLLSEANHHFETRQFEQAEKLYLQAAAEDPKCVLAYNRLGMIFLDRPDSLNDAEEAFQQAFKFAPHNGYVLNNLGLVAFQKGLFNEAVSFYEQAIAADEANSSRHANIGMAYLSLRQYSKAVRHLARAWALEPDNASFKEMLDEAKERERRLRLTRG